MDLIKATNRLVELCEQVYAAKNEIDFMWCTVKAQSYSKAIRDICGGQSWLSVIEFVEDVFRVRDIPTMTGIPTVYQRQPETV